ncbi:unnamed protein product [Danaus chrysippus]|uniref:(African queen) hypothetical protein n=1 Tax=Danaus chrysippus TaxID=151541 RepID=A0A8J2QR39_9NEOP|nr:unnamed protein product [Danaus chrysippus]
MSLDVNLSEPDEFNCIELHDCIKNVAEIKGIKDFVYHVDVVCGCGENFIANVFRVIIKEAEIDHSCSVIVKTLINTSRQELFRELHKREVKAYKEVVNKYVELQKCIPPDDRVIIPECIYTSITKNNEVIVLEDLSDVGFKMDKRLVSHQKLGHEHVYLIIAELAKFHALSFVYENKEDDFDSVRKEFNDLIFNDTFLNKAKLRNYFHDSFQTSLNLISDANVKIKLEKVKDKLIDLLKWYTEPKEFNVFCHGDCWINNVLFRDQDTKRDLCFVDYQALRYANPVTDILYFVYICTDSEFRSEHFENIIKIYYDNFKLFLEQFDINGETVYPQNVFEKDMKEFLPFGLLIALVELRIVSSSSNVMSDELNEYDNKIESQHEDLKTRVNDVVNESINNDVLDKLLQLIK